MAVDYPPIADHGVIGDLQTAALVAKDGTVDWFCVPRFDSPSVFASLLDRKHGGRFALAPVDGEHVTSQMYLPNTAILVTRFMSESGVAEVSDFMPIGRPTVATDKHRLIRLVVGIRGTVKFAARIEPRFDYGRAPHRVVPHENGVILEGLAPHLGLSSSWPVEADGDDVTAQFTIKAGEAGAMILESGKKPSPAKVSRRHLTGCFADTASFWRNWLATGTYRGRWREAVERSAITLKLMQYAPTGGMVAAPTAGLPEQVGGERNWDYRYTWIRDASFTVRALSMLGFADEAMALGLWIRDRLEERATEPGPPLAVVYRADGSSDLCEETLDHFEGYRKSSPVRIGNGAADQLQLDIYGEGMDALWQMQQRSGIVPDRGWRDLCQMLEWLSENWNQPDEGIWETRSGGRPFTYGRMMSWVAFDRAIRAAAHAGRPADLDRWMAERDRIYELIMTRAWNSSLRAFVQYEDSDVLDASLLLMPAMGIVTSADEKWAATLAAMEKTLVSDSLVYRYDPAAAPDGLRGSEGTFSLCTFFYVGALTRSGRLDSARLVFEKMLTYANHLGLFSEEIGLTGEQLGNFPQAFTHLSLINAAVVLDEQLDRASAPARRA
jgi:GH15 family glucan-1,4-alpha-glucosidase